MNDFFVSELKSKVPLSSVIQRFCHVKVNGSRKIACCPFHKEKTPSFHINDEKGFYHCFGCNMHGDTISFLQEYLSLNFIESVRELCEITGTQMPEKNTNKLQNKSNILVDIHHDALLFMKQQINNGARNYLRTRNISEDIIKHFEICFSGNNNNGIYNNLRTKYKDLDITASGICMKDKYSDRIFDRLSNRIIFPIKSHSGKVIAFSGRTFAEENKKTAKYINSPETSIFKKNEILYHFYHAKKTKEKFVIVVEGFMDVIAFYKDGISNAVAQMGTAFGVNHLQTLTARFSEIIFCLDSDQAGINATKRIIEIIFEHTNGEKKISFLTVGNHKDPDEYLEHNGKGSLKKLITNMQSLHEYTWQIFSAHTDFHNPQDIVQLEKTFTSILSKNKNLNIIKHYKHFFKNKIYEKKFRKTNKANNITNSFNQKTQTLDYKLDTTFASHEKLAIEFLYKYRKYITQIEDTISEYEIHTPNSNVRQILNNIIIDNYQENLVLTQSVPKFTNIESVKNYYLMIYYSSVLHQIIEESKNYTTQTMEQMIFYSNERNKIQKILNNLQNKIRNG